MVVMCWIRRRDSDEKGAIKSPIGYDTHVGDALTSIHSSEQQSELKVQGSISPRHGVPSSGPGAAAAKEATTATVMKKAVLKGCIFENWYGVKSELSGEDYK